MRESVMRESVMRECVMRECVMRDAGGAGGDLPRHTSPVTCRNQGGDAAGRRLQIANLKLEI
jgi:hypothetical protein